MAVTMFQISGFILSVLGLVGVIAATAMDQWKIEDRYYKLVTSIYNYEGLWYSCVGETSGLVECRPYFTVLGLPGSFQAVRALMIVGIVLGVIGALISIFALKCIRMGNMEDAMKANMTLTSGILFVVGGVCGIAGVSVFANLIVTNFMFTTTTATMQGSLQPRYTFGPALFMGWVGGAVLVVGGIMMCVACKGMAPEKTHYNAVAYKASRPNTIYKSGDERSRRGFDDDYKKSTTRSDDGRQTQPSRFDYV
ncbi:UNVERIFIED_CONTAM: hypothetical protein FKN15_047463 [Acipenser sinensis]